LGTGKCRQERAIKNVWHLPFAGITLFRFYGFNLSLKQYCSQHPGEETMCIVSVLQKYVRKIE